MPEDQRSLAKSKIKVFIPVDIVDPASFPVRIKQRMRVVVFSEFRRNSAGKYFLGPFQQGGGF
ncbi:hypothetical protein D3C87_1881040 [compost metagenome]